MDTNQISLRQLRCFVTVAEELHFRRAAQRLNMSQPPLTQRIKDMERDLGIELFRRLGKKVELTDAGRVVLKPARAMLAQAEDLYDVAERAGRGEYGRIRIGMTISALFFHSVGQTMRSFRQQHPGVTLELTLVTSGPALEGLQQRKFDLCLVRSFPAPLPPSCEETVIARDCMMLVLPAGHPQAKNPRVPLSAVFGENYVSLTGRRRTAIYHQIMNLWERSGLVPRITQEADNGPAVLALVAAGFGNAILPSVLQAIRFKHAVWKTIDINDRWTESSLNLVHHKDTLDERVPAGLIECLQHISNADAGRSGRQRDWGL